MVDDQAAVVLSFDHGNRDIDLDSVSLKVKEPHAFAALLRGGVFVRRRRMNGADRCLTGHQRYHRVSLMILTHLYCTCLKTASLSRIQEFCGVPVSPAYWVNCGYRDTFHKQTCI